MIFELFVVALVAILCAFVYYTLSVYRTKKQYQHIPGTEPNRIFGFLLGNIDKMYDAEGNRRPLSEVFFNEFQIHKSKTVKLRFLNIGSVLTCDPRLIKEVLITQDFNKSPAVYNSIGYPGGERFIGRGLVTETNKQRWQYRRALFDPGFHRQILKSFTKEFNVKSDILVNHLKEFANNQNEPIKLLEKLSRTALDIIASVAFSIEVDSINDPNNKLNSYVHESISGIDMYFTDIALKLKPSKWSKIKRHREAIRNLRDLGRKQIELRIEAIKNGEELPNDILTTILKTHGTQDFYLEDMVDDFVTFFIAGQETTANALGFTFMELGRHPETLEKLRNEIDKEIGKKQEIEHDDLAKLKYTSCVFKEALRLYPPAAELVRQTEDDVRLDDIFIPKNTWLNISIYTSGRNEDAFKDAQNFNPDRFLNQETFPNYTYFPFAMGPRNCIGQNFAQIEAKIIIAKIIQNFNYKLDENQSFGITQLSTIRPKDGVKCFITTR